MKKKKRKRFTQTAILKHFKAKCKECGTTEHLTTHHKNGDPSDDLVKNLEILCLSCHRKKEGIFYKKGYYK